MTLIATVVMQGYVLQVSDRLVTLGSGAPHDPLANKTVVYIASDALVSASYSGGAYVGQLTTDVWLAGQLVGASLGTERAMLQIGLLAPPRGLGPSIEQLRREAELAYVSSALRRQALEVVVAGIQWYRRKRLRPVMWVIAPTPSDRAQYRTEHLRRVARDRFELAVTGLVGDDGFTEDDARRTCASLSAVGRDVQEAEAVLIEAIREVARRSQRVGHDCMSVLIPPPDPPRAIVRFHPRVPTHTTIVTRSRGALEIPSAYTPLVLQASAVHHPSVISGNGSFLQFGAFRIEIEAPVVPPNSGLHRSIDSHPREPPP